MEIFCKGLNFSSNCSNNLLKYAQSVADSIFLVETSIYLENVYFNHYNGQIYLLKMP